MRGERGRPRKCQRPVAVEVLGKFVFGAACSRGFWVTFRSVCGGDALGLPLERVPVSQLSAEREGASS